jgi:hypothetical protein
MRTVVPAEQRVFRVELNGFVRLKIVLGRIGVLVEIVFFTL